MLALLTLCTCGDGTDKTKAQVRFVNAGSGYVALDLVASERFGAVGTGDIDQCVDIDLAKTASEIRRAGTGSSRAASSKNHDLHTW